MGDRIALHFRQNSSDFEVMWVKRLEGKNEYRAGLRYLFPEKNLWKLQEPEPSQRTTVSH